MRQVRHGHLPHGLCTALGHGGRNGLGTRQGGQHSADACGRDAVAIGGLHIVDGVIAAGVEVLVHAHLLGGIAVNTDQQVIAILMEAQAGTIDALAAGVEQDPVGAAAAVVDDIPLQNYPE